MILFIYLFLCVCIVFSMCVYVFILYIYIYVCIYYICIYIYIYIYIYYICIYILCILPILCIIYSLFRDGSMPIILPLNHSHCLIIQADSAHLFRPAAAGRCSAERSLNKNYFPRVGTSAVQTFSADASLNRQRETRRKYGCTHGHRPWVTGGPARLRKPPPYQPLH